MAERQAETMDAFRVFSNCRLLCLQLVYNHGYVYWLVLHLLFRNNFYFQEVVR